MKIDDEDLFSGYAEWISILKVVKNRLFSKKSKQGEG